MNSYMIEVRARLDRFADAGPGRELGDIPMIVGVWAYLRDELMVNSSGDLEDEDLRTKIDAISYMDQTVMSILDYPGIVKDRIVHADERPIIYQVADLLGIPGKDLKDGLSNCPDHVAQVFGVKGSGQ